MYLIKNKISDDWLVDLTRCSYKDDGCNPEDGFDCKGLLVHIYNRIGIPITVESLLSWRHHLDEVPVSEWPNVQRYWGIGFKNEEGLVTHCGVAISPSDFVHAGSKFRSVVCEPISRYPMIAFMARPKIEIVEL